MSTKVNRLVFSIMMVVLESESRLEAIGVLGELRKLGFPTLNLNSPENGLLLTHDLHAAYDYTLHSNRKVRISFDKNYKLTKYE